MHNYYFCLSSYYRSAFSVFVFYLLSEALFELIVLIEDGVEVGCQVPLQLLDLRQLVGFGKFEELC